LWAGNPALQPALEPAPHWIPGQPAGKPAAANIGCPNCGEAALCNQVAQLTRWREAGAIGFGRDLGGEQGVQLISGL
jgi:hypothetical protein